jgi:hypothetical protein
MPVPSILFSDTDPVAFRRWCRFQLYDMPAATQEMVINALRTLLGGAKRQIILAAMQVDLPGVGLAYDPSHQMQITIRQAPHLLVFRFYTGHPAQLAPARLFQMDHSYEAMIRILKGEEEADERERQGLPRFKQRDPTKTHDRRGRPVPKGRLGSSSYLTTPHMLREEIAVRPADLQNRVGSNERDGMIFHTISEVTIWDATRKAEAWMAYKHQTGRRDMSPYLSCTAVMPRMVRSGSGVLRLEVMPLAPYLGIFLVPQANYVVEWIHRVATEVDAVKHSVEEIEVLYHPFPPMEQCQVVRFRNPFCLANGAAPIPGAGSPGDAGTQTLLTTADPGFAPDHLPGLIYGSEGALLTLD